MADVKDTGVAAGTQGENSNVTGAEHRQPTTSNHGADYDEKATVSMSSDDDGDDVPTEEELLTLRRVRDHIPFKVFSVAFVELCERFSYYGTTVVCSSPCSPAIQHVLT